MRIGELINKYRTENDVSMSEFAKKSGLSKAYVGFLEKGYNPKTKKEITPSIQTIKKVAVGIGMDFDELFSMIDDNVLLNSAEDTAAEACTCYDNIFPIELKRFPLLGDIACGEPIYAEEDRESYVMAGTDIHADFCLRAKGDSMIGARINDGDIVFIRKDEEIIDGQIYAVVIDDEATLKRVYYDREKNIIQLTPANDNYKPLVYTGETLDEIRVLGKAVAFQSDII